MLLLYPAAVHAVMPETSRIREQFLAMFEQRESRWRDHGGKEFKYKYRLFTPDHAKHPGKLPLVVWLHGLPACGDDNRNQLGGLPELMFTPPERERYPFYLLAFQCPRQNPRVGGTRAGLPDNAVVLMAIIEDCLQEFSIDEERMTIVGISSGGGGTWEMITRFPGRFAAAAPISAGTRMVASEVFESTSVWTFINEADAGVPWSQSQPVIDAINAAGGHARLSVTKSFAGDNDHDSWTAAFFDYDLLDWLIKQKRGEFKGFNAYNPKGAITRYLRGWTWKELAMQSALFAVLAFAVWSLLPVRWKPHRKAKSTTVSTDSSEGAEETGTKIVAPF